MTFVEVIVLIAVLSALAGLTLLQPPLGAPSDKARRASCLNNLKQIGLSLRLYSGDYNERFPCDASGTTLGSFALLTNSYQTSYKTWICPSDIGVTAATASSPFTATNLSYAYGAFLLTEIAPTNMPLACDRSSVGNPTGTNPWKRNRWTHKSDGGYVLFADGRVEFRQTINPPMSGAKNP